MACSSQTRGRGFLPGAALSRRAMVGGGTFPGDAKPPGLDIWWSVDHLRTCVIEFYMEYIIYTRTRLPYVRVIMVFTRVSLTELLFQTVMGWILALKCILSDVHGLLQPHPILSGNK
jgi:hypothetical protein